MTGSDDLVVVFQVDALPGQAGWTLCFHHAVLFSVEGVRMGSTRKVEAKIIAADSDENVICAECIRTRNTS